MNICGVNINCFQTDDLFSPFEVPKLVVTVNAEAIVRSQNDERLRRIINNNFSTIDGQISLWLYKLKHKRQPIEKISGSDLIYSLPRFAAENGYRVFLLGGNEESNDGAVKVLKRIYPTLVIKGFSPPYSPYPFSNEANEIILTKLKEFQPQILFVGFGMGKQEFWEEDNQEFLNSLGVKLIIGCGGSFDFVSGRIKRAPLFIQKSGLEGFWRLAQEFKWFRIKRLLLSAKIFYYYLIDILKSKD